MKRPGDDEPAFAQTISGAWELFHEVVSARMRVLSSGEVQSALMARKRWVDVLACACVVFLGQNVDEGVRDRRQSTLMCSIAWSSLDWFLATMQTLAPCCASLVARALPMPLEPPVIRTV
jgi:hypothetical protein